MEVKDLVGAIYYLPFMNLQIITLCSLFASAAWMTNIHAQSVPIIEIQGQTDTSPFEGQVVTITGKVTEYFGDHWYMQDAFGAWNGIYIVGPDVVIPANTPYWNSDRQPEVGDVLEISGTVEELNGNTQLVNVELIEFVDFWNATPMGVWVTAVELQNEQYEGTRVRLDNATVLTAPDADGYWTVQLEDGVVTCWGIDTYDPSGNEDPDGPTPGDVYQVFGASHQNGSEYVVHVGDIDVVSLGVEDIMVSSMFIYPNPTNGLIYVEGEWNQLEVAHVEVVDATGTTCLSDHFVSGERRMMDLSSLARGVYFVQITSVESSSEKVIFRLLKNE